MAVVPPPAPTLARFAQAMALINTYRDQQREQRNTHVAQPIAATPVVSASGSVFADVGAGRPVTALSSTIQDLLGSPFGVPY
eukprot:3028817-Lingulodinium_polyedra.AAC.1